MSSTTTSASSATHATVSATAGAPAAPQVQIARTIYLLSQAATVGVSKERMRSVIRQLHAMTDEPALPLEVRRICLQVLEDWHRAQQQHFPDTIESQGQAVALH